MPWGEETPDHLRPSDRRAPDREVYDTAEDFFEELKRRVSLLAQAPYMVEGYILRLANNGAVGVFDSAREDEAYSMHSHYLDGLDVYDDEMDDGVQLGVAPGYENKVLAAEFGTSRTPIQPLWRELNGALGPNADRLSKELAEVVAERVAKGEGLEEEDLDEILPLEDLPEDAVMDSLRRIRDEWRARVAKEER